MKEGRSKKKNNILSPRNLLIGFVVIILLLLIFNYFYLVFSYNNFGFNEDFKLGSLYESKSDSPDRRLTCKDLNCESFVLNNEVIRCGICIEPKEGDAYCKYGCDNTCESCEFNGKVTINKYVCQSLLPTTPLIECPDGKSTCKYVKDPGRVSCPGCGERSLCPNCKKDCGPCGLPYDDGSGCKCFPYPEGARCSSDSGSNEYFGRCSLKDGKTKCIQECSKNSECLNKGAVCVHGSCTV